MRQLINKKTGKAGDLGQRDSASAEDLGGSLGSLGPVSLCRRCGRPVGTLGAEPGCGHRTRV